MSRLARYLLATRGVLLPVVVLVSAIFIHIPHVQAAGIGSENYTGTAFSYTGQTSSTMTGITFSQDGSYMYLTSNPSSNILYQYSLSTPWNISTATYVRSYSLTSTGPDAVRFSTDGTRMFVMEFYNPSIRQYNLSTAWNIATASSTAVKYFSTGNYYTFNMKSDGSVLYAFDSYTNKIYQYSLSTPWDLTSISASPTSNYAMTDSAYMFGSAFSSDGSKLYINRTTTFSSYDGTVRQYNLSTPWSISTASSTGPSNDLSVYAQDRYANGIDINPSNSDLYLVGATSGKRNVFWYSLSAPDITVPSTTMSVPTQNSIVSGSAVTLTAAATDNQGIAGVTFYANGVRVGSEVTSAPYTTTWDSTTATGTSATLIAVARDTSNNYATSSPITVTVSNGTPTIAASNLSLGPISVGSTTLSWVNGNGTGRIVFVSATTTSGSPSPVNNTTYTPSTTFGSGSQIGTTGWYAVYASTSAATSTMIYGLDTSKSYQIKVVEYNGQVGNETYLSSGGTGNPYTKNPYTGSTIYADYTNGNDSTGNGSSGNPYKTFTKAYTAAIDGDTLNLSGTFTWTNAGETGDSSPNGFTISKPLTIVGQGAGTTTLQASGSYGVGSVERVFTLAASTTLSIQSLSMRYGYANSNGGGCLYVNSGAALNLLKVDLSYCQANNVTGAGIISLASSTVTIDHSSVRNNNSVSYGGGIYALGNLIVTDSTINNNTTSVASAYGGAAASVGSKAWFINSTITGNYGYFGAILTQSSGNAYLINTIVAGNTALQSANADIYKNGGTFGTFTSLGNNIIGRNVTASGISSTTGDWNDPSGSGTFTKYGGGTGTLSLSASTTDPTYGTLVFVPQSSSIAVNNASTTSSITVGSSTLTVPSTDQVYAARGGSPDIGAVEYGGVVVDVTPPTITVTASTTTSTSFSIAFNTNEQSDTTFRYGTTTAYGTTLVDSGLPTHAYNVTTLTPGTTYHYLLTATDTSGNTSTTSDSTFTTTALPVPTISSLESTTNATSTVITFNTNVSSNVTLQFGTTTAYGITLTDSATTTHRFSLSSLLQSTAYHFQITAVDASTSASTTSVDYTVMTIPDTIPPILSGVANGVTVSSAVFDWLTDEPATSYVTYGTTTSYGMASSTPTLDTMHAVYIYGLIPSALYHFRYSSTDAYGNTSTSSDMTFTTYAVGAPTPTLQSIVLGMNSVQIRWSTPVDSTSQVLFGPIYPYSSSTPEIDNPVRVQSHTVTINGLVPCTLYHFSVTGSNISSVSASSADGTVATTDCTGGAAVNSTQQGTIPVSTGGIVSNGAFTLTVPTGFTAATTSAFFQLRNIDRTAFFAAAQTPSGMQAAGSDVFTATSLATPSTKISTFDSPLTITLSYTLSQVAGLDLTSLKIYRYDSGVWTALTGCSTNTSAQTVTCQTSNFSDFALFGSPVSVATQSGSSDSDTSSSSRSGSSISEQVANLLAMGNSAAANALKAQWPQLFGVVPTPATASATTTISTQPSTTSFARNLQIGMTNTDVVVLQKFLNAHGAPIALSGSGSAGNETTYFGSLTKKALAKYQSAHGISPASGYFGPVTRAYVATHR